VCKDKISSEDTKLISYTFTIPLIFDDFDKIQQNYQDLDIFLNNNNLQPIGVLPVADKGVVIGIFYAKYKDLSCDDYKKVCVELINLF
jgi:hypothetical protein